MKRILFIILAALVATTAVEAKKMSDLTVVIDPGHGGYDGDDRPIHIYPYEQNSEAGYWESKSNLVKGLYLKAILDSLGVDAHITRTHNTYNEIDGDGIPDEPSLTTRAYMANNLGADCFFSIHSNAGEGVNYPLMIYHKGGKYDDRTGQLTTYKPENKALSEVVNSVFNTSVYSNWINYRGQVDTVSAGRVTADVDLLGYSLGVLRNLHGVGMLSEGGMHEHRPQAHRLMNDDYNWLEAWYFAKSLMIHFDTEDRFVTGNIAGVVYDNHNLREFTYETNYHYFGRDAFAAINGAKVELLDASGNVVQHRVTDNDYNGVYVFRNITPGVYTVKVSHDNYYTEEYKVSVVADKVTYKDAPVTLKREEPLKILSFGPNTTEKPDSAVSCASTINFEFNFDVDQEAFEKAFSISPAVEGYFEYSNSYHKVKFIPTLSLEIGTEYTVTVSTEAKTTDTYYASPNMQEQLQFKFLTQSRNRLEMIDNYPAEGGAVHFEAPTFEFRFDNLIDYSNFADLIKVYDSKNKSLSINTRSTKFNRLSNGFGNAIVVLNDDLTIGENYTVSISGELRDKENLPMNVDQKINFTAKNEAGIKEGEMLEGFNVSGLFAYDVDATVNVASKPSNAISSAKYLFDKKSNKLGYSFSDNRNGVVVWNYVAPDTIARTFAKGDKLGLHVYGDFNNHELWVGVTQGTDTKYVKLCDLNFRGWEYHEVELTELEEGYDYNFSHIKIVQVTSPITQKGEIFIDDLYVQRKADGVEGVIADAKNAVNIYPVPANDIVNVEAPFAINAIELYNIRGAKIMEVNGVSKINVEDVPQGVYVIKVIADDTTISRRISISR